MISLNSNKINVLKIIAIITMTIDHIGYLNNIDIFRGIGRVAFPLFTLILVYNYIYFSSNKYKYFKRVFLLAIFSTPFYFYFNSLFPSSYLNILFSLSSIILLIIFHEWLEKQINNENSVIFILIFSCLTIEYLFKFFVNMEYGLIGIFSGYILYLYYKMDKFIYFVFFLVLVYLYNTFEYNLWGVIGMIVILYGINKIIIPINLKLNRYAWYLYYPIHLMILKFIF